MIPYSLGMFGNYLVPRANIQVLASTEGKIKGDKNASINIFCKRSGLP